MVQREHCEESATSPRTRRQPWVQFLQQKGPPECCCEGQASEWWDKHSLFEGTS